MLIQAPCRLGERFAHKKPWGYSPLYLTVLMPSYFYGEEKVVFQGGITVENTYNMDYIAERDLLDRPVRLTIPNHMVRGGAGATLREFGLEQDRLGWLTTLRLEKGEWRYWIAGEQGTRELQVRTPELDRLFAPILPAVKLSVADFL